MRAISNRAANRLVEVPQWEDQHVEDSTSKVRIAICMYLIPLQAHFLGLRHSFFI